MLIPLSLIIFLFQSEAFIFDDFYDTFNIERNQNIYGYNINHVCRLKKIGNYYYGTVESPYTFQKSSPSMISSMTNGSKPLACFQYEGYSYIFYSKDEVLGVIRGKEEKTFKILLNYTKFSYDHLCSRLYFLSNGNKIYEFSLGNLEKFWTVKNYAQWLVQNKRNVTFNILYKEILEFPFTIEEYFIFNNTLYYKTEDEKNIMKMKIIGGEVSRIKTEIRINETVVFLNFRDLENYLIKRPESLVKTALSLNPSFIISLPMPPDNPVHIFPYLLYILSLLVLFSFLYICRRRFKHKNFSHPHNTPSNGIYFDLIQK